MSRVGDAVPPPALLIDADEAITLLRKRWARAREADIEFRAGLIEAIAVIEEAVRIARGDLVLGLRRARPGPLLAHAPHDGTAPADVERQGWRPMIHVRFNRVVKASNRDADRFVGYVLIPAVPRVGELINIDGEPYYVLEVSYAVETDPEHRPADGGSPRSTPCTPTCASSGRCRGSILSKPRSAPAPVPTR